MRFSQRQTHPVVHQWGLPGVGALLAITCFLGLSACRSDRVAVNPKDLDSPQYSYRLDELALLHMTADDIQELERKKQYGRIYDEYGSDAFKQSVSRRRFLIMANCVETLLGGLEEYNRNAIGFRREQIQGSHGSSTVDVLNRKVDRVQAKMEEQLVFVPFEFKFKLNGLYWISKDKPFLQCIAQSPQVETNTTPKSEENAALPLSPEGSTGANSGTPGTQSAVSVGASGTMPENKPAEQAASTRGVPASNGAPIPAEPASGRGASPNEATPLPFEPMNSGSAVQGMRPNEIRKEPLQARPAGAGAVIDQRPTATSSKHHHHKNPKNPAVESGGGNRVEPESPAPSTEPQEAKPLEPVAEPNAH